MVWRHSYQSRPSRNLWRPAVTASKLASWKNGTRLIPGPAFAVAATLALFAAPAVHADNAAKRCLTLQWQPATKAEGCSAAKHSAFVYHHFTVHNACSDVVTFHWADNAFESSLGTSGTIYEYAPDIGPGQTLRDEVECVAQARIHWCANFKDTALKESDGKCELLRSASAAVERVPVEGGGPALTREERRRVQAALAGRGTDPGPADGVFGPRTRAAMRAWQSSKGYAATGELTEGQVRELLGAQPRTVEVETEQEQTAPGGGGNLWGSIAFSQESGGGYAWAIVWNSAGHEAATRQALEVCRREGGGSCHEAGWFRNSCGALALGDGNGYGVDGGSTTGEAERAALAACRKVNRECRVEVSRCSSQGLETAGVEEPPEPPGPVEGERFRDCSGCPELVVVPAGSYEMGSPSSEEGRGSSEGPVHRVTIGEPFAVGVYEVTFAEWDGCVSDGGCNGYRPDDGGRGRGNRPVINVSWEDAKSYVGWLSRRTGKAYRLLSESEWEYVARAGTRTAYHFGSGISSGQANYGGNYSTRTSPVGSYLSNGFGLHDVHGNVWEWVGDCWHEDYQGAPVDGSAWTSSGNCGDRVLRGGSWLNEPENVRSATRNWSATGNRFDRVGFRVARTLD